MYRILTVLFCLSSTNITKAANIPINYIASSEEFVESIKRGEAVSDYIKIFEYAKEDELANQLATDDQKKTFWLNVYNGFIQVILQNNPDLYNDRSAFFKLKQINVAGTMLSFADIEHGIIRHSQYELFMGYLTNPFPGSYERKFRMDKRDYRVHFALNCGAKSCPPVAVYNIDKINSQLDKSTATYLRRVSKYKANENTVYTTSLFSWFRGDFGGIAGIKEILYDLKIIPQKDCMVKTSNYDWTLDLGNFVTL